MTGTTLKPDMYRKRSDRFTDQAFFRFFWPVFISNLSLAIGGIADCFFVGMKMKAAGLSAIALGIPVYLFYNVLSYGLSIGGSIHYSTALANGHPDEGNRIFNNTLAFLIAVYLITVALGLVFLPEVLILLGAGNAEREVYELAERYVRAQLICVPVLYCQGPAFYFLSCDGAPKRAAAALTISNALDLIFNYIFIVRIGTGPEGSVWSTLIGAVVMLAISSAHILGKKGELRFRRTKFDRKSMESCAKTGLVTAVQYVYMFITTLVANKLLISRIGTDGVAVFDVVYNITLFTAVIADSMEMGLQPMVRCFKAEKNGGAVKRCFRLSVATGGVMAAAEMLLVALFAEPICSLFGLSSGAAAEGVKAILIYCISIVPAVINQCVIYYDQAADREREAFILSTLRTFVFWIAALIAIMHFIPEYFFAVYAVAEALTLIKVICGRKERAADWKTGEDGNRYEFYMTEATDLGAEVEKFQEVCEGWECTPQQSYYGTLILEELCAAILNDAAGKSNAGVSIIGTAIHEGDGIALFIRDDAVRFNPFELKDEDGESTVALGINIVKKKAKEFFYRRYQGFNTLVVRM